MTRVTGLGAGLALVLIAATAGGVQRDVLQEYQPVSSDRLSQPADADWLMIRRTYDGWGYSPLHQITPANVARLQPVWTFATGAVNGHEAPPLVNNGVMFVVDAGQPGDRARSRDGTRAAGATSARCPRRGAAAPDQPRRGALRRQGVPRRQRSGARRARRAHRQGGVDAPRSRDNSNGYYMTLAPLVADGKVMVGASGGELGVRGFRRGVRRRDRQGSCGARSRCRRRASRAARRGRKGDQWKTGGGPIWVTGNYDPETNLAFWGTGNGGPWMGDQRPGDNLYTASTLAIDVATGAIQGPLPISPERLVGLGRGVAADPRRLHARRPDHQRA